MKTTKVAALFAILISLGLAQPTFALEGERPETLSEIQRKTLKLVNKERRKRGLSALTRSSNLNRAAMAYAKELTRRGYGLHSTFNSHVGLNGSNVTSRTRAAGINACVSLENLAWGQKDTDEVFRDWMTSAGHKKNILYPKITHFGMAHYGRTWVMMGSKNCKRRAPWRRLIKTSAAR